MFGDRSVGSIPDVLSLNVPFFALESDKNGWFINWWCTVRDFCAHASILLVYTVLYPFEVRENTELEVCQPLNPSKSPILGVPKHLRSFLFLGTWEHHQRPHRGTRARRFLSSTWEHSHRTVFQLGGRILHMWKSWDAYHVYIKTVDIFIQCLTIHSPIFKPPSKP